MSAFLCSAAHLSAIVNAIPPREMAYVLPTGDGTGEKVFQVLAVANAMSVDHRYSSRDSMHDIAGYRYDIGVRVSPLVALKAVQCLRYQSCEIPEYETSVGAEVLRRAEQRIIATLPGYETAEGWGIAERPMSGVISLAALARREPGAVAQAAALTAGQKAAATRRANEAKKRQQARDNARN